MMQNDTATLGEILAHFEKIMQLPSHLAIALLGIYLREMKMYVPTRASTHIFIAAFLLIAKD